MAFAGGKRQRCSAKMPCSKRKKNCCQKAKQKCKFANNKCTEISGGTCSECVNNPFEDLFGVIKATGACKNHFSVDTKEVTLAVTKGLLNDSGLYRFKFRIDGGSFDDRIVFSLGGNSVDVVGSVRFVPYY